MVQGIFFIFFRNCTADYFMSFLGCDDEESDCFVYSCTRKVRLAYIVEVVAQVINSCFCSSSCSETVESLSASSSAASNQNFLTPTFLVSVALSCRK